MARHATNDYGAPAAAPAGSNRFHRPALLATHALHLISSLIVLGISAYFIANFRHNTHLRYWVSIAAVDSLLYIPLLFLSATRNYKGYTAPLTLIFSYLWLTAFIFASQDYDFNGGPFANSPAFVAKSALKKTLEAFAFIAFFTNLVGFILESRLWDVHRFNGTHTYDADKHHAAPTADAPATATV